MEKTTDPNADPMNFTYSNPDFDNLDLFTEFLMSDYDVSKDGFDEEDSSSSSMNTFNSSEKVSGGTPPASTVSFSNPNTESKIEKKKKEKETKRSVGFRLKSSIDVLDDGYRWRKYGKKPIRGTPHPRHYHKCSHEGCNVKKKVERDLEDPSYVKIIYIGIHNHEIPSVVYCEAHEVTNLMSHNSLVFTAFPSS